MNEIDLDASVIVPARNAETWIGHQLAALSKQSYTGRWEVIIADNGSTDGTREAVESWMPKLPHLRLVDASRMLGGGHARNVGATAARGRFLAFCDADDVADPHWLEAMMHASENAQFVGGTLDMTQLNTAEQRAWYGNEVAYPGVREWPAYLPVTTGANFGLSAELLARLGGFNTSFIRGEDIELSWRACQLGYPPAAAPGALVHYRLRPAGVEAWKHIYWYGKGEARLYKEFSERGMPRRPIKTIVSSWLWGVGGSVVSPLLGRRARVHPRRILAKNLGRLVGSLQIRTFYI